MKLETRDFGTLEINEEEVVTFRLPVYGFEELKTFALLYDDAAESPFCWLQSVEDQNICFILTEPHAVGFSDYAPVLPKEALRVLDLQEEPPVYRVIAVIPADFQEATVNLKSPIVINPARKCAVQVILEEDYPIRARLIPSKEAQRSC